MVRRVPRASAGLSRLAASPVPAAPPAPTRVWVSSMNRMIGLGLAWTSSITERRRCSNSPFMLAPACSRPTSSVRSSTSLRLGGTSPRAMRWAKPSTTAVLPTPASPIRMGLFWRRRMRMSTTWRISSSRPTIGSILPERAWSVRSVVKRLRASCLPSWAGGMAPLASPGWAAEPSAADRNSSGEPATILANSSVRVSPRMRSNSREMAISAPRRLGVLSMPMSRWPVRTWLSRNISEPYTQPRSTACSTWSDRSEMEVAPRGRRSRALVTSPASRPASSSKWRTMRCRSESGVCRICWTQ